MSIKVIHTWLFALLIKHFPNVPLNINMEKQGKYAYFSTYSSTSLLGYFRIYWDIWQFTRPIYLNDFLQLTYSTFTSHTFGISELVSTFFLFFSWLTFACFLHYRVKWCSSSLKSHQPAY